jgi:glutaconyl-CoA/methylmalonyl-CoA decarboxylase subunit gamma
MATYRVKVGEKILQAEVEDINSHPVIVRVGDERFEVWVQEEEGPPGYRPAAVAPPPAPVLTIPDPHAIAAQPAHRPMGGRTIRAPMPGQIKQVSVTPGAHVTRGDLLCLLEAMKMNNQIRAPHDGLIAEVYASVGAQVNYGDPLLRYE